LYFGYKGNLALWKVDFDSSESLFFFNYRCLKGGSDFFDIELSFSWNSLPNFFP